MWSLAGRAAHIPVAEAQPGGAIADPHPGGLLPFSTAGR